MCFICHLDAFASVPGEADQNEPKQDVFNGGLLNQIGVNTHYVKEFGDKEVMMDTKRKFSV